MQTEYYADNRDLVKWGTLIHLCRREGLKKIVQVPFLQPESGGARRLFIDGSPAVFPPEVWAHFRDLKHIEALGGQAGLRIKVLDELFVHKQRDEYMKQLCSRLCVMKEPKAVFLDPDTGIEPQAATAKHVKVCEIAQIWGVLRKKDWLVVYQHRPQRVASVVDWRKGPKRKFESGCGLARAVTFESKTLAPDVAFFAARKT